MSLFPNQRHCCCWRLRRRIYVVDDDDVRVHLTISLIQIVLNYPVFEGLSDKDRRTATAGSLLETECSPALRLVVLGEDRFRRASQSSSSGRSLTHIYSLENSTVFWG